MTLTTLAALPRRIVPVLTMQKPILPGPSLHPSALHGEKHFDPFTMSYLDLWVESLFGRVRQHYLIEVFPDNRTGIIDTESGLHTLSCLMVATR